MILALIRAVIRWRVVVWALVAAGVLFSAYSIRTASLDAIPDISDPQIVVYVKWPRSAQLLETEVTEPLISALVGSPDIQALRGSSHMGYSFIYVILSNTARRDKAQQLVLDRIAAIRPELPPDASVTLGPNASSMGWIYQYALVDRQRMHDLRDLRLVNESQIKPALQTVPGIAEVASVGGLEKQYQIKIFPPLLAKAGIPLKQVIVAVQGVFQEAGGRMIEVTNRDYQLRGIVSTEAIEKLDLLVVGRHADGTPIAMARPANEKRLIVCLKPTSGNAVNTTLNRRMAIGPIAVRTFLRNNSVTTMSTTSSIPRVSKNCRSVAQIQADRS